MKIPFKKTFSRLKTMGELKSLMPGFEMWESRKAEIQERLEPHHRHYVQNVSNERSAVSFETATMLAFLCELRRPARILDVGSGFSSFVFRSYQKNAPDKVEVISLDNDKEWLNKTREYLQNNDLGLEGVMEFDQFLSANMGKFDLALHDLGNLDERKRHLKTVLRASHEKTVVVLDDFHKDHYRENIQQQLHELKIPHTSLYGFTLDKYSRYASVIVGVSSDQLK